jgi:hypothetical protein
MDARQWRARRVRPKAVELRIVESRSGTGVEGFWNVGCREDEERFGRTRVKPPFEDAEAVAQAQPRGGEPVCPWSADSELDDAVGLPQVDPAPALILDF